MNISPSGLLSLLAGLTLTGWTFNYVMNLVRMRTMERWAREARLFYAPVDVLGLAPRVGRMLDFPGAAHVRITDLMYRSDGGSQRCLFTVEYTRGVMSHRSRVVRVAFLTEPISRKGVGDVTLTMAPEDLPRLEQYRILAAELPDEAA